VNDVIEFLFRLVKFGKTELLKRRKEERKLFARDRRRLVSSAMRANESAAARDAFAAAVVTYILIHCRLPCDF
jgi:hypothetical protein